MLTILIPTHKRPELFKRCVDSVYNNCPDTEIIVNNDSFDVPSDNRYKIFYNKFDELTDVYKFLVSQVKTKYLYFLEDDDYLLPNFKNKIESYLKCDYDLIIGKYLSCEHDLIAIKDFREALKPLKEEFNIESQYFQLGQVIFKRKLFDNFKWFNDSNIHNDYFLTKYFLSISNNYKIINKVLYRQTYNGDNISFGEEYEFNSKNS